MVLLQLFIAHFYLTETKGWLGCRRRMYLSSLLCKFTKRKTKTKYNNVTASCYITKTQNIEHWNHRKLETKDWVISYLVGDLEAWINQIREQPVVLQPVRCISIALQSCRREGPSSAEARSRRLAARGARRPGGRPAADSPWRLLQRTCWRRAAATPLAELSAGSGTMCGAPVPQRTTGSSGATARVKQHSPDRERDGRTGIAVLVIVEDSAFSSVSGQCFLLCVWTGWGRIWPSRPALPQIGPKITCSIRSTLGWHKKKEVLWATSRPISVH
jgi:hypothetical protein